MEQQQFIDEVIEELYKRLQIDSHIAKKKNLLVIGEGQKEELKVLEDIYNIRSWEENINEYEAILILQMSVEQLANLALGCSTQKSDSIILQSLLRQKPVYLLRGGLQYELYKSTAYKPLYQLYCEYEKKIQQYGILIIDHVMEVCKKESIKNMIFPSGKVVDCRNRRLLSETDLFKMHIKGLAVIHVDEGCILTPLAHDFIKNHNLSLKRG